MTARGAVSRQSGSPPRCHSGRQKERGRAGGAGRWEQALKGGLAAGAVILVTPVTTAIGWGD